MLAVADFDGNGLQDVISVGKNAGPNTIKVFLAQPGGTFASPMTLAYGAMNGIPAGAANDIAVGLLDGDGIPDLAIADDNGVTVFRGSVTGELTAIKRMVAGSSPAGVDIGDWNGDGKRDIAVQSSDDTIVSIFMGDGQGDFVPTAIYMFHAVGAKVRGADLDADGAQDLIIASAGFIVARGRGDGTFHAAPTLIIPKDSRDAVLGDWNEDGIVDLDLVVGYRSSGVGEHIEVKYRHKVSLRKSTQTKVYLLCQQV